MYDRSRVAVRAAKSIVIGRAALGTRGRRHIGKTGLPSWSLKLTFSLLVPAQ